jgi:DNA-binding NtrC family response regulator
LNESCERWILVVDDEPDMCWLLARIFRRAGWQVKTAGSGAEALARVEEQKFAAILIDWQLTDMKGTELTEKIHVCDPSAALIMISGLDPKATFLRPAYPNSLIDCFLSKPFEHEHVIQSVESAVLRKRGDI